MSQDTVVCTTTVPPVNPARLPTLTCAACGTRGVPTVGPGTTVHAAAALCRGCGRYLQWLGKDVLGGAQKEFMMESVNLCLLTGYLERDPSLRFREDGLAQCAATMRLEEQREAVTYKTYVALEAYGRTAEALAELHAGAVVIVQGKLCWRKQATASGVERSGGLAVLLQKVTPLSQMPAVVASQN